MLRSTLILVVLAFSASANAQGFSYDYVSLGYGNVDFDEINADGDGFVLGGSFAFTEQLHGFVGYDSAELNSSIDVSRWNAGIGYNTTMSDALDLFARLSYESIDFDIPGPGFDDSGYGLSLGGRYRAGNQIELTAALKHVDYGDLGDDTGLEVGVLYDLTNEWSLGLLAEFSDDVSSYTLTGRYYFGR